MSDLKSIRIANLGRLCKARGWGPSELAAHAGRRRSSYWSDLLRGANSFGEKVARSIEEELQLPRGWLDDGDDIPKMPPTGVVLLRRFDLEAAAGAGRYIDAMIRVESVKVSIDIASRVQRHAGVALASLALITVAGDSMEPTLRDGDIVVVDHSAREVDRDGIYIFTLGQATFIKRMQRMPTAIRACSDNKNYESWDIQNDETVDMHVHGRAVWVWGGRGL